MPFHGLAHHARRRAAPRRAAGILHRARHAGNCGHHGRNAHGSRLSARPRRALWCRKGCANREPRRRSLKKRPTSTRRAPSLTGWPNGPQKASATPRNSALQRGRDGARLSASRAGRARRPPGTLNSRSDDAIFKARAFRSAAVTRCTGLQRAATRGHAEAHAPLADSIFKGFGPSGEPDRRDNASLFSAAEFREPDFAEARRWAERAAAAGSADGQAALGYILTAGPELMRDFEAGHPAVRTVSRGRLPPGRTRLWAVADGARRRRRGEAEGRGHRSSRRGRRVGGRHLPAWRPDRKRRRRREERNDGGRALPESGAERRSFRAETMGPGLAAGTRGRAERDRRRILAQAGGAWRRWRSGGLRRRLYARDGALPPNHTEAAIWYRRAAETGHATAARSLGLMHMTGAGVARDPEAAARWLSVAAEAGDRRARTDLANLYLRGVGNPEDWPRLAASSRKQQPAATWSRLATSASVSPRGSGCSGTSRRRLNGCAAPRGALRKHNTSMGGCSSKGGAWRRTRRKDGRGSRAPQEQASRTLRPLSPR